ncbi:MAG: hypothetical protein J7L82_02015 [Staphylothermus sp.]|nr:hypothetical protein [Staphylothermus sp.]
MEGYSITGNYATASYVGNTNAESFEKACFNLLKDDDYFDMGNLSIWGCRLFDNEADARESFG